MSFLFQKIYDYLFDLNKNDLFGVELFGPKKINAPRKTQPLAPGLNICQGNLQHLSHRLDEGCITGKNGT